MNAVRTQLADSLADELGARASDVVGASMEGPAGGSGPLLEEIVGASPPFDSGDVVIAMAFCLPGRHAGPGGDVEAILQRARDRSGGRLRTHVTPLLAASPGVHEMLAERARAAIDAVVWPPPAHRSDARRGRSVYEE